MPLNFSELEAELARNTSVDESAIALIKAFADQIDAAKGDAGKLSELTSQMRSQSDALAAAVAANTPGETGGGTEGGGTEGGAAASRKR